MERHIWRHHGGFGEPVDNFGNTRRQQLLYQKKTNLKFGHNYNNNIQYKWPPPFRSRFKESNIGKAGTYGTDYKSRWDFMDDITEPFKKMLEHQKVVGELIRSNQQWFYPRPYPANYQYPLYFAPLNYSNLQSMVFDPLVVGYLAYACKDCRVIDPLQVYLTSRGVVQDRHECSPQRLQDVHHLLHKEKEISKLYSRLPEVMKKIVNKWTNNQNYIFAVEIQKEQISNHNIIDLDITATDKNSWAARAIKDNHTMLTDEELVDFLRRCKYNTLSYFKVHLLFQTQGLLLYYMIGIVPIERSTNKSNDQGSNSISSIPTPEPEMTLEEFFLSTKSY